ncbi:MAG: class I SAM-dependent methyltransferase [Nanoarchaeota archaeon]
MEEKFGEFFTDKTYIEIKNSLFNYRNRVKHVKTEFLKFNNVKIVKALDIGSGISPVSPVPKNTLFMDLSEDAVNFLVSKGLKAKSGSITDLNFKAEFNWIFCSEVLEHIEDYRKAISEMHKALNKEGRAIITVPVHMKYWNRDDEFVEHYRRFDPYKLKADFETAGFKVLKMKPIGSFLDKYLTLLTVDSFKRSKKGKIGSFKKNIILFVNNILYYLVRASLYVNSEKSTNIMLYVVEK